MLPRPVEGIDDRGQDRQSGDVQSILNDALSLVITRKRNLPARLGQARRGRLDRHGTRIAARVGGESSGGGSEGNNGGRGLGCDRVEKISVYDIQHMHAAHVQFGGRGEDLGVRQGSLPLQAPENPLRGKTQRTSKGH